MMSSEKNGIITGVTGPVVDVRFDKNSVPDIFNALKVENNGKTFVLEVLEHLGGGSAVAEQHRCKVFRFPHRASVHHVE